MAVVTDLAVLATAPLLTDPATDATAVLERYGPAVADRSRAMLVVPTPAGPAGWWS
ncbi:hypothetical protein ACFWVP_29075 [Streptomyces sp. NPDC058637]|uniref:hypothetical protein n=1 Tax=Streptomyces sp. NPDC058637 TaxID=3346569 RepID=UPI00364EED44